MWIVYTLVYIAAGLLLWLAVQSMKNPMPRFKRSVEKTWQFILFAGGIGFIMSTFFF